MKMQYWISAKFPFLPIAIAFWLKIMYRFKAIRNDIY